MATMNKAGEDIIKQSENCRLHVYKDFKGIPTIGWGHTSGVTLATPPCTQAQADAWLEEDLADAIETVENFLEVEVNDNQFSAMVSLVYNEGNKPLIGHFGKYVNAGDFAAASNEFCKWVYCDGKILDGLVTRRNRERVLFITPMQEL